MTFVRMRDNESIEEGLRRFKRGCEKEGVIKEAKRRQFHETPALKKKRKLDEVRKNKKRRRF